MFLAFYLMIVNFANAKPYSYSWDTDIRVRGELLDMGIVGIGDTTVNMFNVNNNGEKDIFIGTQDPFFFIGRHPDNDCITCWSSFDAKNTSVVKISPAQKFTLPIKLIGDYGIDSVNHRYALLKLTPNDVNQFDEINESLLDTNINLKILGRISRKPLGSYVPFSIGDTIEKSAHVDTLRFDTILRNSNRVKSTWTIKNLSDGDITLGQISRETISNQFCENITLNQSDIPNILVEGKNEVDIPIYHNAEIGCRSNNDTVKFSLTYNAGQIRDTSKVVATSTSILLDIGIVATSTFNDLPIPNLSPKSLDLGDININSRNTLSLIYENMSDIDIFIREAEIGEVSHLDSIESEIISAVFFPGTDISHDLEFIAERPGRFEMPITVYQTIDSARFLNQTASTGVYKFNISGNIIAPLLDNELDSLDFGSIVINPNCPESIDTVFRVYNSGNLPLDIRVPSIGNDEFTVEGSDTTLLENEYLDIRVTYFPKGISKTVSRLEIRSNSLGVNSVLSIPLIGEALESSQVEIEIPNSRAKPGSTISIPLKIDYDRIEDAKLFSALLEFDYSLLEFIEHKTVNTASGLLSRTSQIGPAIDSLGFGYLPITLIPGEDGFVESDTLILLDFAVYLGKETESELRLINPKVGNNNCDNALNLSVTNGLFLLDSVLGLESKAYRERTLPNLRIADLGESIELSLVKNRISESHDDDEEAEELHLFIYNYLGERIYSHKMENPKRIVHVSKDILGRGAVFISLQSAGFNKIISKPYIID
ncbi:MAG: hypothetical protein Kapaf2KO_21390 [Candidatus Kapaibacteriales bacterium]